jgi:hypothetical protein
MFDMDKAREKLGHDDPTPLYPDQEEPAAA